MELLSALISQLRLQRTLFCIVPMIDFLLYFHMSNGINIAYQPKSFNAVCREPIYAPNDKEGLLRSGWGYANYGFVHNTTHLYPSLFNLWDQTHLGIASAMH